MKQLHTSRLNEFHAAVVASGGNFQDRSLSDRFYPLQLVHDTRVDQDLSPYSSQYFDQQLALYREIAGRDLDQSSGELHPENLDRLLDTPNPLGIANVRDMAQHVRAVSTQLCLAGLSGSPHVLDLGAGHGLSSEVYAFAGCQVHAVDIDPGLSDMSRQRARRRGLPIERSVMNYDDLGGLENGKYEAAFFFQSLHHCLRPWALIEQLKAKLTADGVIAFAGEPIQTLWWKNWGLRLDEVSLYVARAHGWFESGWSHAFIRDCFERNGLLFDFYTGGHLGGEIGIATRSEVKREQVASQAQQIGLSLFDPAAAAVRFPPERFRSQAGDSAGLFGRAGYRQRDGLEGVLLFGPYVDLEPGAFELSVLAQCDSSRNPGKMVLDVVSDRGEKTYFVETLSADEIAGGRLITGKFWIPAPASQCEIRVAVTGLRHWHVSVPIVQSI